MRPRERLATPNGLVGEGQTVLSRRAVNGVQALELTYEHEDAEWWHGDWMIPWTADKTLVFTAQAPAHQITAAAAAVERVVSELVEQDADRRPLES
jgi:hypothetical protein